MKICIAYFPSLDNIGEQVKRLFAVEYKTVPYFIVVRGNKHYIACFYNGNYVGLIPYQSYQDALEALRELNYA